MPTPEELVFQVDDSVIKASKLAQVNYQKMVTTSDNNMPHILYKILDDKRQQICCLLLIFLAMFLKHFMF